MKTLTVTVVVLALALGYAEAKDKDEHADPIDKWIENCVMINVEIARGLDYVLDKDLDKSAREWIINDLSQLSSVFDNLGCSYIYQEQRRFRSG